MNLSESGLTFEFLDGVSAIKFDDTAYYKNTFQKLPSGKGVDFLVEYPDGIIFIEVKNCKGNEADNRYRIAPNNAKINTAPTTVNTINRESLDVEVSKKVAMTLACLMGANSRAQYQNSDELKSYSLRIMDSAIAAGRKSIKILLFLEGDFGTVTCPKVQVMKLILDNIKKKLSWLNCQVFVEDSDTQRKRFFEVTES